jgi:preprotein translocase subunit SecE
MARILNYISEAFEELKSNVTWPECEVQRLTVVAVFSVLFMMCRVDEFAKAFLIF